MSTLLNRPSATTTIRPAMELATSRIYGISHWLSTNNRHLKIGLAIAIPSVVLLLTTTPITNKLAQAWRRATGKPSPNKETARAERAEPGSNDIPPELPKKSYGQLPSRTRAARPERSEHNTTDKLPELPKMPYERPSPEKRAPRPERNEHLINNTNNTNNVSNSNSSPASPTKSYAAAAAATPTTTASVDPFLPGTPDSASINSQSSSSHSQKRKFRLRQNIKKRWQNRPFGHGSSESPLSL